MKNLVQGRMNRFTYFVGHFIWWGIMVVVIVGISILFAVYRLVLVFVGSSESYPVSPTGLVPVAMAQESSLVAPPVASPELHFRSIDDHRPEDNLGPVGQAFTGILNLLFFFALLLTLLIPLVGSFSLQIRRLHDIGQSGLFVLLNLVPPVGAILWFVLFFIPGDPGANKWGKNPGEGVAAVSYIVGLGRY